MPQTPIIKLSSLHGKSGTADPPPNNRVSPQYINITTTPPPFIAIFFKRSACYSSLSLTYSEMVGSFGRVYVCVFDIKPSSLPLGWVGRLTLKIVRVSIAVIKRDVIITSCSCATTFTFTILFEYCETDLETDSMVTRNGSYLNDKRLNKLCRRL